MFPSLRSPRNIMGINMCPQQCILVYQSLKNAMRVYAAELICSKGGVIGFLTFKPVFCIDYKLRLHADILC